jgi:hypothetical protein
MISTLTIFAESAVSVETVVKSDADPTATTPGWALTTLDDMTAGSTSAGTWSVAYSATTDKATARSPLIGGSQTLALTSGNSYRLWLSVVAGSETMVEPVAIIHCP